MTGARPEPAPAPDASTPPAPDLFPPPAPAAPARRSWLRAAGRLLAWWVGGALVGLLIGYSAARLDLPLAQAWPDVPVWAVLVGAALALWPHIVLHEAGHALAGLARGMRAIAFGVGRWRWERSVDGWRVRNGGAVAGIGGFAALVPQGERGLSRLDQSIFLLGGPMANLMLAGLALACVPWLAGAPLAAALCLGIALAGLFLGGINLVPFHTQGWRSDGQGLLDLCRRSPDAALQMQIVRLMALYQAGVRPRDWPAALVPPAVPDQPGSLLAANSDLLRLSFAMDRGDHTGAEAAAQALRARFHAAPAAFQPHLAVAVAGYVARSAAQPAAALHAWRPLCEGGLVDLSLLRHWLDAEIAAHDGDIGAARTAVGQARRRLGQAPDPVTALLLTEYLDQLDARLDEPGIM